MSQPDAYADTQCSCVDDLIWSSWEPCEETGLLYHCIVKGPRLRWVSMSPGTIAVTGSSQSPSLLHDGTALVISHNPFLVLIILACTFSGFSIYVTGAMLYLLPHLHFLQASPCIYRMATIPCHLQLLFASQASSEFLVI